MNKLKWWEFLGRSQNPRSRPDLGALTCRDFELLWNEQFDGRGRASEAVDQALERHAASCPACQAISSRYQTLRHAIKVWGPGPAPPAGFVNRCLARLESRPPALAQPTKRMVAWTRSAAAAVLLLAGLMVLRGHLTRSDPRGARPSLTETHRPLTAALADATSATFELALAASAPAARIGRDVLNSDAFPDSATTLSVSGTTVPASEVLQHVGDRINAGVRPLSGSARHAFGFLLEPALGDEPAKGSDRGA